MFKEFNLQQLCSKSRITLVAQKLRPFKIGEWQGCGYSKEEESAQGGQFINWYQPVYF